MRIWLLLQVPPARGEVDSHRGVTSCRRFAQSVLVSGQDKALDFYTNVLGLEKRVENPTPTGRGI